MLPSWLASYRAKKRTRLALSVYRSNIQGTYVKTDDIGVGVLELTDIIQEFNSLSALGFPTHHTFRRYRGGKEFYTAARRPPSRRSTRSQAEASRGLWVAMIEVSP